jgi:predicted GNAT family N-acyltransferase
LSTGCRLTVTVRQARDAAEVDAALDLRVRVFCGEQGVTREEELDGLDDEATQVVALDDRGVVATCRLRFIEELGPAGESYCKLERMAVDKRARGLGVGGRLLDASERIADERGAGRMLLHAQTKAQSFYAAHGYVPEGELFLDARIEHVRMTKTLESGPAEDAG